MVMAAMLVLAACGGAGGSGSGGSDGSGASASVDDIKTVGDAMAFSSEESQRAFYDDVLVYVFKVDDTYYRVIADLPEETSKALWDLDFMDEDYETKYNDLVYPLEIRELEDLSEQKLSQEEMDAFVGKTGKELVEAGWRTGMGYNLNDMEFWLDYGPFEYAVVFDGETDSTNFDDIDEEEFISERTVKSIEYLSIGDATNIE